MQKKILFRLISVAGSLALLAGGLGIAHSAYDDPLWPVTRTNGITYGRGGIDGGAGNKDLQLDLFEPTGSTYTMKPAVVLVHGGGFTSGNRNSMTFLAEHFASRGYVAVSITYRLLGENPVADPAYFFFQQSLGPAVHAAAVDAKRAIRWLRANAESLGIDEDFIFIGGISAGGFTSMHAGVSSDDVFATELPGQTEIAINNPYESAAVHGILNFCGGAMPSHFDASDPPVLIVHTVGDSIVPVVAADLVEDLCLENEIPYEYYRLAGGSHCSFFGQLVDGLSISDLMTRFLNQKVWELTPPKPEPTMVPTTKFIIKDDATPPYQLLRRRLSFIAKTRVTDAAPVAPQAGGDSDPSTEGARLEIYNPGGDPDEIREYILPASGWKQVGKDAKRGYKYSDPQGTNGAVLRLRLRDGLLKIVGRGAAMFGLSAAPQNELALQLHLGSGTTYCAATEAGGNDSKDVYQAIRQTSPPGECPRHP